jgi:hypothetical protein
VAAVLAWPPSVGYLNYFGSDAFLPGLLLLIVALFWRLLLRPSLADTLGLGILLGFATAVKLTLLPLTVGCVLALAADRLVHASLGSAARRVAALVGMAVLAFSLSTFPVVDHMLGVVYRWAVWLGPYADQPAHMLWRALGAVPPRWATLAFTATLMLVGVASFGALITWRRRLQDQLVRPEPAAVWSFLGLVGSFWLLIVVRGIIDGDDWLGLRMATGATAAVSVAVLAAAQPLAALTRTRARQAVVVAGAVVFAAASAIGHGAQRHTFIRQAQHQADLRAAALDSLAGPNERAALWFSGASSPATFHFDGNYLYGTERFDAELLRLFPTRTLFRLPQVVAPLVPAPTPRSSAAAQIHERLRRSQGSDYFWPLDRPYVGYQQGSCATILVAPIGEWRTPARPSSDTVSRLLAPTIGATSVDTVHAGNAQWIVWTTLCTSDPAH